MIKRLSAFICATILTLNTFASDKHSTGLTAANAFVSAPQLLLPSIDRSTRLDMIDYFNAGSDKESKNLFDSGCRITALTPEQLTFTTSSAAFREISLLPCGRDTVIMMITTLLTPIADSDVAFFTSDWQPLKKKLFHAPGLADWLAPETKAVSGSLADAENIYPFLLVSASYDPATEVLTLTNNLSEYLTPEDERAGSAPQLLTTLNYHWDGRKMVLIKK